MHHIVATVAHALLRAASSLTRRPVFP
jgi:hypothetical protein